jgi:hypothetical protein
MHDVLFLSMGLVSNFRNKEKSFPYGHLTLAHLWALPASNLAPASAPAKELLFVHDLRQKRPGLGRSLIVALTLLPSSPVFFFTRYV